MTAPDTSWEEENYGVTVTVLKVLLGQFWSAKQEVNDLKKQLEAAEKNQTEWKDKLLERMEQEGMQRFDGPDCFVSITEKRYVTTPKTQEDKQALFFWLQEHKVYWDYVGINHQSLQSLYKEQKEISGEENFSLPGIGPEKTRTDLRAYKQKQKG